MNPDLLAQLKDIETPAQVGSWPLAWGWWVVIVLATLILISLIVWLVKQYQLRHAKRQAIKLLKQCEQMEPRAKVAAINDVLKRANLAYQHRDLVAELSGSKWANWLNQHKDKIQISPELLQLSYKPQCNEEDAQLYYLQTKQWLEKALPLKPVATSTEEAKHV